MSAAHALLAPSAAARWVACAGSVMLAALYPDEETEDSRNGTAAHWAAQELFEGRLIDTGLVAPNGVVLTEEMCEGAQLYYDDVKATCAANPEALGRLAVERRVAMPSIHAANWGTPDLRVYVPSTRTLYIWDYKFGHRYVEVFENWQLVDYVSGIIDELGLDDQATRVVFRIVQPRSFHKDGPIREWSVVASDLRPLWNKLRNAAEAALMPNALCTPNPECQFCPARHACEALQRSAYKAADMAGASVPVELSPMALGLELSMLQRARDRLAARITGLEEQALSNIRGGKLVPGFATEYGQGREKWTKPIPEVIALGQLYGVPLEKRDAITPKQARDKGIPASVIESYSARSFGGLQLVVDDGTLARKVFGK